MGPVVHMPGKYKIVSGGAAAGSCARLGQVLDYIAEGTDVDIIEVQVVAEDGQVRGKMSDGRWISITSTSGGWTRTWAKQIPLATQLMELGFSEVQAVKASKLCSSMEAAVEYLHSPSPT